MDLTPNLRTDISTPLYQQIYEYIKSEIICGNLTSGTKLPSTRVLSTSLDVSRSTVCLAFDQLLSEGYIESVSCRGYFVSQLDGLYNIKPKPASIAVPYVADAPKYLVDFSPNGVDLEHFPFNTWRKVTKNVLTVDSKELFNIGDPKGELFLRTNIASYLHQSRGILCSPEQIILGAGNEYLLMILHHILGSEAVFAMENPTYAKAFKTLNGLGHMIHAISMDNSGMSVAGLEECDANIAYVTPSHQYPLGIVMPVKRRSELLSWACKGSDRYIIEDDYDSEFRYRGKPIPALLGSDTHGKVIYLGTFSKSIAPAIRMSYMVLPAALLDIYNSKCRHFSCTVSRIDQAVVNSFIEEGYYERHLNKMRGHYKVCHDLLLAQLQPFEKYFKIDGENAGLHLLLTSKEKRNEKDLIASAKKLGVKVYPLSQYYIKPSDKAIKDTVILGYATLSEEQIIQGTSLLKKAWQIK
ncbi:MAG: PLP-dependent aminotransferase family protein [Lachnospiraceae bacterium]